MKDPKSLKDVEVGEVVTIKTDYGDTIKGKIKRILGKNNYHIFGIKVEIDKEMVGRIQEIHSTFSEMEILKQLETEFRMNLKLEESESLEFKAAFRFDLKKFEHTNEKCQSDKGAHSIAKTIAAFANNKGGTLYIGIYNHPRRILGLTNDYEWIGEKAKFNEFLQQLRIYMERLLSKHDFQECVEDRRILHLPEGDVCVIKVKPTKIPVIVAPNTDRPELYVRSGDNSQQYQNIQEFCDYWYEHMCTAKN